MFWTSIDRAHLQSSVGIEMTDYCGPVEAKFRQIDCQHQDFWAGSSWKPAKQRLNSSRMNAALEGCEAEVKVYG